MHKRMACAGSAMIRREAMVDKRKLYTLRKMSLVSVAVNGLITERVEVMLHFTHERVKPRLHIRQLVAHMVHKHLKKSCSKPAQLASKKRMEKGVRT